MKDFIKHRVRTILESMPNELIGQVSINIPFNRLVLDRLNLEWAIDNIKENRPSRSKNNPMQVAMSYDKKYYLLDGYHRLVEAVLSGKSSTRGILLNKTYDELRKNNQIGVGCSGGSGDEHCNNLKTLGSIDMIKQTINEQMIDGQDMSKATQILCNKLTIDSYEEAVALVNAALQEFDEQTKHKIMQKIVTPLENLRHEQAKINGEVKSKYMSGDSVPDEADTYWHQIQSTICELGSDFE